MKDILICAAIVFWVMFLVLAVLSAFVKQRKSLCRRCSLLFFVFGIAMVLGVSMFM